VPSGAPSQRRCGERSAPPGTPNIPLAWAAAITWPSVMSSLTSENDGTFGM
jgi:hypothetical protein